MTLLKQLKILLLGKQRQCFTTAPRGQKLDESSRLSLPIQRVSGLPWLQETQALNKPKNNRTYCAGLVLSFVLHNLEFPGKRELQLRNCLAQIFLWPMFEELPVLIDVRSPSPLWAWAVKESQLNRSQWVAFLHPSVPAGVSALTSFSEILTWECEQKLFPLPSCFWSW